MPKLTEEQRAELLASNVSRTLVDEVLARIATLESAIESVLAETYVPDERECPCCGGEWQHAPTWSLGASGFNHASDCTVIALGLDALPRLPPPPFHGPIQPPRLANRDDLRAVHEWASEQLELMARNAMSSTLPGPER